MTPPDAHDPIVIVAYDACWPEAYAREAELLASALGEHLVAIEHVGSTAVPGLAAKPVIDLMAAVPDVEQAVATGGEALAAIGYHVAPESGDDPDHRFVRRPPPPARRTHHLHLVRAGSDWLERHVRFRDLLRADPRLRTAYAELKLRLADAHGQDRDAYVDAKTRFIEGALRA